MLSDNWNVTFNLAWHPRPCVPPVPRSDSRICYFLRWRPHGRCIWIDSRGIIDRVHRVSLLTRLSCERCPLKHHRSKTWRSSFYLFSGVTFLSFVVGVIYIDNDVPSGEVDKRIDWLGAFLVTVGLILIIFSLSQGTNTLRRWATPCKSTAACKIF